jgi:hypothetical protein
MRIGSEAVAHAICGDFCATRRAALSALDTALK